MTLTLLVPSSLVREAEDKREATRKLGYVARAAAVFGADRLSIFPDPVGEERWGMSFVETVLRYAATPPYLRKEAFGMQEELTDVGVLPPLQFSSQTGSGSNDSESIREGIVTEVGPEERVRVNCGLQHPISLIVPPDMVVGEGERVTVRISSRRPVRARLVDTPSPGFRVERVDLTAALSAPDAGFRIATSRHGTPLTLDRLRTVVDRVERDGTTIAFGAPGRGLPDILGVTPESIDADGAVRTADESERFDLWLNTIPHQRSAVVRTEEAMFASLACVTLTE